MPMPRITASRTPSRLPISITTLGVTPAALSAAVESAPRGRALLAHDHALAFEFAQLDRSAAREAMILAREHHDRMAPVRDQQHALVGSV